MELVARVQRDCCQQCEMQCLYLSRAVPIPALCRRFSQAADVNQLRLLTSICKWDASSDVLSKRFEFKNESVSTR